MVINKKKLMWLLQPNEPSVNRLQYSNSDMIKKQFNTIIVLTPTNPNSNVVHQIIKRLNRKKKSMEQNKKMTTIHHIDSC
jgi:hypothetical protein